MLIPSLKMLRQRLDQRALLMRDLDVLFAEVAERMLSRLEYIKHEPKWIADIGCGSGRDLQRVLDVYPKAAVVGLDVSFQRLMPAIQALQGQDTLQRFSQRWKKWIGAAQPLWVSQADFHALPLKPSTVDLLWSNLALHWSENPEQVLREWRTALAQGGLLMFSVFGPDTFQELRQAAQLLRPKPQVMSLMDMHDWGDMLFQGGYSTPVMDMERITLTYDSAQALLKDVHALGGAFPLEQGLRGRSWQIDFLKALDAIAARQGEHRLTFEIIYGHAWKIERSGMMQIDENGQSQAAIPISAIGGRKKQA